MGDLGGQRVRVRQAQAQAIDERGGRRVGNGTAWTAQYRHAGARRCPREQTPETMTGATTLLDSRVGNGETTVAHPTLLS
jgi:hypothetical protein